MSNYLVFTKAVRVTGDLMASFVFAGNEELEEWAATEYPKLKEEYENLSYITSDLPGLRVGDVCLVSGEGLDTFKILGVKMYGRNNYAFMVRGGSLDLWEPVAKCYRPGTANTEKPPEAGEALGQKVQDVTNADVKLATSVTLTAGCTSIAEELNNGKYISSIYTAKDGMSAKVSFSKRELHVKLTKVGDLLCAQVITQFGFEHGFAYISPSKFDISVHDSVELYPSSLCLAGSKDCDAPITASIEYSEEYLSKLIKAIKEIGGTVECVEI